MPRANLALGHFEREQPGESERVLLNMYPEPNGGDKARPVRLVTTPGSRDMDTGDVIQGTIRGMAQSDAFASGKILILDGTTLRTWVPSTGTFGTISGTVTGTGRADMAFTQTELAVLSNGSLFVSAGTTIAAATDPDFPSNITSIAANSQRILMTAGDGKWYFTSVLDVDDITGLQFYSAESQPDNLVAVRTFGETVLLFGGKTVELWYAAGDANDPYSRQSNVIATGCLCRDGIRVLKDSVIWINEDYEVVRWQGGAPVVISEPWLTRLLKAETVADIIATHYYADGQGFYSVNMTDGCYVFGLASMLWHKRQTLVTRSGEVSATIAGPTLVAMGELLIRGSANAIIAGPTLSSTGALAISGATDATLAGPTLVSTIVLAPGNTGATDATLAGPTLAATGALAITGATDATLAGPTLAATGALAIAETADTTAIKADTTATTADAA